MAKATPKKVMTPKAASNDKSPKILGVQKQKTPKSAGKALKPSTPQVMPMAAAIKKRKSVATLFEVSDMAEEKTPKKTIASPAKTPLTGKKQKKSVQPQTPEVESVQTKKKKKQSLVVDAVEEAPTKTKKKSLAAQTETPTSTPNDKKKKKLSVAAATTSMPFKVEKKMKPTTAAAPVAESSTGAEPAKKRKRNRGKKSKSGGGVEGAIPSKEAKVDSEEGASPSKKAKMDPDVIQLKTGKGKGAKPERSVYTLYVGNLSYK
jgi:hypothetical protein